MIRFFSLLPRRQDVSAQEFHDHWRHPHGSMGRLIPGLDDYIQAHRVDAPELPTGQDRFEGVAISSFSNSAAAMALLEEPQYVDHVKPDEPSFQDLDGVRFLSTDEEVLVARVAGDTAHPADLLWNVLDRPTSVQLLQFVHLGGNAAWAGEEDEALGHRLAAFRHARNRPSEEVHGDDPPFLGARQLWWPTVSHFQRAVSADGAALTQLLDQAGDSTTMLTVSERLLR